ncbi:uncharacterized protein LOC132270603 [Cornus florida]|uniref:uncharacterized protein LOC132270603 n=1 Tax=Cornus florida TaxID=4283 RepID=UPI00289E6091|nr:uncharacterized protein LOC132270603 [Cornus florida]
MRKEIEVYVDDMIAKSVYEEEHLINLGKLFRRLRKMNPLKYIFENPILTGCISRWQMLLIEFNIVYVTQKLVKAGAIAEYLAENPTDDYRPIETYFPDEAILLAMEEEEIEQEVKWKMYFDGAVNKKGVGIGAIIVSNVNLMHYPIATKLKFYCTNNMAKYKAYIIGLQAALDIAIEKLIVFSDLELIINQITGEWQVKNAKLIPYNRYLIGLCW